MFQVGDTVVYGINGVCKISEITTRQVAKQTMDYYVLRPIHDDNSTLFVPVDSEQLKSRMLPLLTKTEANDILKRLSSHDDIWIDDDVKRKDKFTSILQSGDRLGILLVLRAIADHKRRLDAQGKHLHLHDKKLFTNAQKVIDGEFSLVLGIEPGEVKAYMMKSLA